MYTGVEDSAYTYQLWGESSWAAGKDLVPKITQLPTGGKLYVVDAADSSTVDAATEITAVGQLVTSYSRYVRYVPAQDGASSGAGVPYDTFTYALTVGGLEQATPTTVKIILASVNDLPVVTGGSYTLAEDAAAKLIPLVASDAETGTMLDLSLTSLPTKGDVYLTTDGTVVGRLSSPIARKYSNFDAGGEVYSQVPTEVLGVSSFWGNPPSTDYHPSSMLGNQSCFSVGECPNEQAWVSDATAYPNPGTKLIVTGDAGGVAMAGLPAKVVATDAAAGTVTVEYLKMFVKPDGTAPSGPGALVQCHIAAGGSYPAGCVASNVPASGVVRATVPRADIAGTGADNWCPLYKGFAGNVTMEGAGAFGSQYAYRHNQIDYYLTEGYTEYIEVRLARPMYVVMVEFGMSRGMGAIVGVKARRAPLPQRRGTQT